MSGIKRKFKTLDYFFTKKSRRQIPPVAAAAYHQMLVISSDATDVKIFTSADADVRF